VEVWPIQSNLRSFSLDKKTRVLERACSVAKEGVIGPIFEGDMPPYKMIPKYDAASGIIAGELLRNRTNAHRTDLMGSTVNNLVRF
jgi:hypothetical protein